MRNLYGMDEITTSQIRAVAHRIQLAADGYKALAEELEAVALSSVKTRGLPTLVDSTLSRVEAPLSSLRRAVATARMNAEAQRDVEELKAKIDAGLTGRKPKKD